MKGSIFASLGPLERLLDFHLARQSVLASNVANAETPGYRRRDITFAEAVERTIAPTVTNPAHHGGGAGHGGPAFAIEVDEGEPRSPDGNNVRLEQEMAKLTANRLRYETGVEIVRRELAMLRYAATDGGR